MIKPLFRRIAVAVNGSERSSAAAMYGVMMAKTLGCEMKAVYVVDTATLRQLEMLKFLHAEERARYEERLISDGERHLAEVVRLAAEKRVSVETELRRGAVWAEIERGADDFSADLILLGGRAGGGTARHDRVSAENSEIIGSSARSVLVVKDADVEKKFRLL